MLPEGWKRLPLGEIAQITSGGTPDRSEPKYWGGDIPWVTTGEIQFNTITDTAEKITEAGLKGSSAKLFPPGTLLMAMYGQGKTRGQVAKLGIEASTNQNSAAILLGPQQHADYYYHFLSWKYESIREFGNSGGVSHLNAGLLKQIAVPCAPYSEQRIISGVLKTWDDAIATSEKLLANSRRQKQSLMQQLLTGRQRLPGFAIGWQQYRLGRLFNERVENGRGDLALLSITREEGVIPRDGVGRKDTSNDDKSKYLRICPGDIGYNTMRMWQGVSALSAYEGIISPAYTVLVPTSLIDARFATYLFKFDPIIHLFYRYSQGLVSDTWNLKYSHLKTIKVTVPERKEQEAIAAVLRTADQQIALLESKLTLLNDEKRALMQQLLTGKRRVRLSGLEAEESPS
ncbi:EcoKI restriction-modification system protein HsdS [Azoarcus sp. Aa7]|nr:EcoKI restriction-modification system protein HsdS [Azoarcus sp. Aa7]